MKLKFFTNKFVQKLRENAATNAVNYGPKCDWLDAFSGTTVCIRESGFVVGPPPQLTISENDNPKNDAVNAQKIFHWLRMLTPAVAMEERLWAYLAHSVFAEYMHARWAVTGEALVKRRYLFEGRSFGALVRHGIARLWWAGYLTKDDTRANPFELTEILFLRQDVQLALLDRSMGKCRMVRMCVLEYLRDNFDWLSTAAAGKRIQVLVRELNLLGAITVLDSLTPGDVRTRLEKIGSTFGEQ